MKVQELHRAAFGAEPVVVFAPGRVNLIGEHTDYNDGLVLPVPLPVGITVAISAGDAGRLRAQSTEFAGKVDRSLDEAAQDHWSDFLVGAIKVADLDHGQGFDVSVASTMPVGASISSSAALCVSMLRGLRALLGLDWNDVAVARLAQRVENEFIGLRCGLMDQMASSAGRPGQAMLFDVQSGEIANHAMIPGTTILTIHSGLTRSLKENAYNARRASCERACADLGVPSLREARLEDLDRIQDDDDRMKARHVITENHRVERAVVAIDVGDAPALGQILYEGHESLSRDYEVSKPQIDTMVEFARSQGAIGARMTGAGFGGCFVVLAATETADTLANLITAEFPDAWLVSKLSF